jgi:hypothetical protein
LKTILRLDNKISIFLIFSVLFAIQYAYLTKCGIDLSPDSTSYINAANHLIRYGSFGKDYLNWPPLFPIILTFYDPIILTYVLNCVCILGTIMVLYFIGNTSFHYLYFSIFYLIVLVFGRPLFIVSRSLWSESIFLLLFSVLLLQYFFFLKHRSIKYFIYLILVSFLLCLQRHSGFFLVVGLSIAISFQVGRKRFYPLVYFIFSVSGSIAWNFYNFYESHGNFNFLSHQYFSGILLNIDHYLFIMNDWFIPLKMIFRIRFLLFNVALIFLTWFYFFNKREAQIKGLDIGQAFLIITLVYGFSMSSLGLVAFSDIERFLSVIYPLIFYIITLTLDFFYSTLKTFLSKTIFIFITSSFLIVPIITNISMLRNWQQENCIRK